MKLAPGSAPQAGQRRSARVKSDAIGGGEAFDLFQRTLGLSVGGQLELGLRLLLSLVLFASGHMTNRQDVCKRNRTFRYRLEQWG